MDKKTKRVIYYMQKLTDFHSLPSEKQAWRYPRLLKYKEAMNKQLRSD